jgi:hypothetical protein
VFHPFFDDWSAHALLVAALDYSSELEVIFGISNSLFIPELTRRRAGAHFDRFELGVMFSTYANAELVSRRKFLVGAYEDSPASLLSEITRELASRRMESQNSWQTALYTALRNDAAFLAGGVNLIREVTPA